MFTVTADMFGEILRYSSNAQGLFNNVIRRDNISQSKTNFSPTAHYTK